MKVTTLDFCAALALSSFAMTALSEAKPPNNPPAQQTMTNPQRIRVDGREQAKLLVAKVRPAYPIEALKNRIQGTVRLHVIIDKGGAVYQTEVVSGDPRLISPAIDAVRQWRYRSTIINGWPVEVDTTVDVFFAAGQWVMGSLF
jgi:periplasmic protein TonB